jgi:chromosome segregation ATPase
MSVQNLVTLASVLGAGLFMLAGYIMRGMRQQPVPLTPTPDFPQENLEAERRARADAEKGAQQARGQLAEREKTLAEREKQLDDIQRRYDELLNSVDENPTQVSKPDARAVPTADFQALEREGAKLRKQLEDERQARQQAEQKLALANKAVTAPKAAKDKGAELDQLRKKFRVEEERWTKERNDLKAQVNAAKTAQDKAQVQRDELRKHVETLKREQKQLQSKAAGAAEKAAGSGKLQQAEQRVQRLEQQLQSATAKLNEQEGLRSELQKLRQQAVTAQNELKRSREELAAAAQAGKELDAARGQLSELEAKLQRATQTTAGATATLRDENIRLKEEAEQLRAKVAELEFKGEDTAASLKNLDEAKSEIRDLQKKLVVAEQRAQSSEALRDELAQLRAQVEESGQQIADKEEMEGLRKKQRELQLKSQMLNERVEQMQVYADENVTLRDRLKSLESAAESLEASQQRVKDLEAKLFARAADDSLEKTAEVVTLNDEETAKVTHTGSVAATLDGQLKRLSREPSCRVAVLADSQGLLLSGSGESRYYEPLAGVAGMIHEMAQRTREFLPLGAPQLVQVSDGNNVSLYARLLKMERELFALCTLGQRRGATDPLVEEVAEALPHVLAGSAASKGA